MAPVLPATVASAAFAFPVLPAINSTAGLAFQFPVLALVLAAANAKAPALVPNDWMENNYLKRESL